MTTKLPSELKPGDRVASNDGPLEVETVVMPTTLFPECAIFVTFTDGTYITMQNRLPVVMA